MPAEILRERIERRRAADSDASDADLAVLDRQLAAAEPLSPAERRYTVGIDAAAPIDTAKLISAVEQTGRAAARR